MLFEKPNNTNIKTQIDSKINKVKYIMQWETRLLVSGNLKHFMIKRNWFKNKFGALIVRNKLGLSNA